MPYVSQKPETVPGVLQVLHVYLLYEWLPTALGSTDISKVGVKVGVGRESSI